MEIWKEVFEFPNYEISNQGNVRRGKTGKPMKAHIDSRGYQVITLRANNWKYTKKIARLVWTTFNDCACGMTVDHIDRNKHNNNLSNLRCISNKDNSKNRDTYTYKSRNTYNLDEATKTQIIYKLRYENYTTHKIWKEYGIPTNYMGSVVKRGTWDKYLHGIPNI